MIVATKGRHGTTSLKETIISIVVVVVVLGNPKQYQLTHKRIDRLMSKGDHIPKGVQLRGIKVFRLFDAHGVARCHQEMDMQTKTKCEQECNVKTINRVVVVRV